MCLYVFHLFYRVREKPVLIFVCLNNIFLQCVPSYYFVIPFGDLKTKQNKYLSLISSIETEHGKISRLLSIHIHFLYTNKNVGSKSGFVRRLSIGHSNIWSGRLNLPLCRMVFFRDYDKEQTVVVTVQRRMRSPHTSNEMEVRVG